MITLALSILLGLKTGRSQIVTPQPYGLTIASPVSNQLFQRNGATGTIDVSGNVGIGTHSLEVRFNNHSWTLVATNASGAYSVSVLSQPSEQGLLEIRWQDRQDVTASKTNIGVGDIFIVAGQSNANGQGTVNQSYSNATVNAVQFANDYNWKILVDPSDSNVNQVDIVSSDVSGGSVWPLLATSYMGAQNAPIAFVPCAKGGTSITAWQPGANHLDRTTLYGSMAYRITQVGGCKAVLWWQGEADNGSMSQATYNAYLDSLANALNTDLGVKLMPCKLQNNLSVVNAAVAEAWADNSNVLTGPDLSGISTPPEDSVHIVTTAKLQSAADLWWAAFKAAFGW